ncbi:MAG: helix-turn-helix domain-containing protein [Solirubrobacteraceae bacterium]|nr:helix-turn-helix domain-containing protein [Solirubrobacteraceae bacterium]
MTSAVSATLDPHFVEAVARRVLELLDSEDSNSARTRTEASLLTVAELAARYGVSRSWVYAHQRELGAMRLGSGPRARLRFDSKVVADAIAAFGRGGGVDAPCRDGKRRGREMPLIAFDPMG